jgi:hypothetical protein
MYAALPPFSKNPRTACGSRAPRTKPPYTRSYCGQLVTSCGLTPDGSVGSPSSALYLSVKPTNAAMAVPTPSMGIEPLGCSSM